MTTIWTSIRSTPPTFVALAILMVTSSAATLVKFGGVVGYVSYVAIVGAWAVTARYAAVGLGRLECRAGGWAWWAVAVTLLIFLLVPVVGTDPLDLSSASDRGQALDVATSRLLAGEHPYRAQTFEGNPITPLPGALIMASPFVYLFGTAAIQSFGWATLTLAAYCVISDNRWIAIVAWASALLLTPESLRDYVTRGDLFINGAYVATATIAIVSLVNRGRSWAVMSGAIWGLTLCSRLHVVAIAPVVLFFLGHRYGYRRAALVGTVAAIVYIVLVVPLWLTSPRDFAPLHVVGNTTGTRGLSWLLLVQATGVLVLTLLSGWWARRRPLYVLFLVCSAVLTTPSILTSWQTLRTTGNVDLWSLAFASPAVPFAAAAVAAAAAWPATPDECTTRPRHTKIADPYI